MSNLMKKKNFLVFGLGLGVIALHMIYCPFSQILEKRAHFFAMYESTAFENKLLNIIKYPMNTSLIEIEEQGILLIMFDHGAQNNQNIPYKRVLNRLVRSIRLYNPSVQIALATNNQKKNWSGFDFVFTPVEWANSTKEVNSKIVGLENSPFKKTIFLDAETVVMGSLQPLFNFLRWYDLALTPQNNWQSKWYLEQVLCGGSTASLEVQYNTGVFAYRKNQITKQFFYQWKKLHETTQCRLKVLSNGKKRGAFDQCSLYQAIRKTDALKVATLEADVWNDRGIKTHYEPTRVAHPHCSTTHGTGCDDTWVHPDHGRTPPKNTEITYSAQFCEQDSF